MKDEWRIPSSTLYWLARIPPTRAVALLLRHSVRGPLPTDHDGFAIPLTETGVRLARELGKILGSRLRTLHTSPLTRCVQTAEALRTGSGMALPIVPDSLLGHPGVYVLDAQRAWSNWQRLGHEGVMAHLVRADIALPGMAEPGPAARYLVRHILTLAGNTPGLHVFVTHDLLVTTTAARLLGQELTVADWPWYLEGAFFWHDPDCLRAVYRTSTSSHK